MNTDLDELAEDDLSDNYDEDEEMTIEQRDQMNTGLVQVRSVLGDEEESGIKDKQIKDALWESYFDVEGTISWLLDQRAKQAAAAVKKGRSIQPPLTALQRLALQRKQAGPTPPTDGSTKSSGLAGLAKGLSRKGPLPSAQSPATGPAISVPTPTPPPPAAKLSKLSALAKICFAAHLFPLSKLAQRIKAQKEAQEAAARPQPPSVIPEPEPDKPTSKSEIELFHALRPAGIDGVSRPLDGSPHTLALKAEPSPFGNVLIARRESVEPGSSFARLYSGIISGPPPSAFQFNTPSPDDAVMAAREGTRLNAFKKASMVVGTKK
ncbi:hypothetical protein RhiJN_19477 [Ceratobasidium sp. AG-Ba]|nr:hypothetical protein RhiJN_19477 [Ceratobasidium sp. AG-Ba]